MTDHSILPRAAPRVADEGLARVWSLAGLGTALVIAVLVGWVWPLSLWRTPGSLPVGTPMVLILGQSFAGATRWAVATFGIGALWLIAVVVARGSARSSVMVAVAFSVVLTGAVVAVNPAGTQDIYHNIADGRTVWRYGDNPTRIPPISYAEDAFAPTVWGYADLPSAYGPVWYLMLGVPYALAGDGVTANVIAQKVMLALAMLGTLALTLCAARGAGIPHQTRVVVLVGWSPLLLWEFAGNGHNDSLMTLLMAASLLAAVRRRWLWVLPLLTLAVLVKYTAALIGPIALVWLLRHPAVPRRTVLASVGLSLLIAAFAFAPMWAGWDTVAAVNRPGMTFILSPATLMHGALSGVTTEADASRLTRGSTAMLFALAYGWTLWRTRGGVTELAARGFDALFLYLTLASWWFWPWYIAWLVPVAAVSGSRARVNALAAMMVTALFTYLYWWTDPDPPWRSMAWYWSYALIVVGVFVVPAMLWMAGTHPWRRASVGSPNGGLSIAVGGQGKARRRGAAATKHQTATPAPDPLDA